MHKSVCHSTGIAGLDAITIRFDRTYPRHTHDEFGLGPIMKGERESWCGRGSVEARYGDVIAIDPGEVQDGLGHPGRSRVWHVAYLSPELISRLTDYDVNQLEFRQPVVGLSELNSVMKDAIRTVMAETPDKAQVEEALVHVIGFLRTEADTPVRHARRYSRSVKDVLARIHDETSEPLSLASLAETAGMSRFKTLRQFKAEVGATPHAYLTQQRVKHAKSLVSAGTPLAEAALSAGLADQSHMTRAFGKQLGVSPGAYVRAQVM